MKKSEENTEEKKEVTLSPEMVQFRNTVEFQEDLNAIVKLSGHTSTSEIMRVAAKHYRRFLEQTFGVVAEPTILLDSGK